VNIPGWIEEGSGTIAEACPVVCSHTLSSSKIGNPLKDVAVIVREFYSCLS